MNLIERMIEAIRSSADSAERHVNSIVDHHEELKQDLTTIRERTDRLYRLVSQMKGPNQDGFH
jgi:chromosome segregation ATPase